MLRKKALWPHKILRKQAKQAVKHGSSNLDAVDGCSLRTLLVEYAFGVPYGIGA
jgi:hypothetical protein